MPLAAIGAIAAVAGTVGSVISANKSANAATQAADTQAAAAHEANVLEEKKWKVGRRDTAPWRYVGGGALNELAALYGIQPYTQGVKTAQPNALGYGTAPAGGGGTTNPDGTTNPAGTNAGGGGGEQISASGVAPGSEQPSGNIQANPGYANPPNWNDPAAVNKWLATYFPQEGEGQPASTAAAPAADGGKTPTSAWDREAAQNAAMGHFFTSPQYSFNLEQGINSLDKSASARGLLLSGAQLKGVQRYGSGLASGEFNNYADRLAQLANLGSGPAQSSAQLASQSGQSQGQNTIYAGNAQAGGYINSANAYNNGINNVVGGIQSLTGGNSYLSSLYGNGGSTASGTGSANTGYQFQPNPDFTQYNF